MEEKYIIVESCGKDGLADAVNKKIKEGYLPQGGVAIEKYTQHTIFYQAMVKNKESGYLRRL